MIDKDGLPRDFRGLHLLLHALVDGELDAAKAMTLERRLAEDPTLAAEHQRIVALRRAVLALPRTEVDPAFAARVAALAQEGEKAPSPANNNTSWKARRDDWRALAASVVVTAGLASGATYWMMAPGMQEDFATAIANDHRRSLLAAAPVDVVSSDRHTVKPWLDARIGVSPPAPDLTKDGFSLVGGRVEVVGNRPVPALVYRYREHLITLVAIPREGTATPMPSKPTGGGFSMLRWDDGAFSYWAVSDAEPSVMEDFAFRFRAAIAP